MIEKYYLDWRPIVWGTSLLLLQTSSLAGTAFFEDVSKSSGVNDAHHTAIFGSGQAWLDVNRDGYLDLFVTDRDGPNHLYVNQADGTFQQLPLFANLASDLDLSAGVAIGDFNNDGWQDIYVACDGPNRLFQNINGQSFVEIGAAAGVDNPHNSQVATWADVNRDGFLDLYLVNYRIATRSSDAGVTVSDAFYINQGDGTFDDIAAELDPSELTKPGLAVTFLDYDQDGDQDLYVINDRLWGNTMWRNDGPPTASCQMTWCFVNVSQETATDRQVFGMGIAVADYDLDGDDDLYFSSQEEQVLLQNQLSQGQAVFIEQSTASGLNFDSAGWATIFLDVDNDTWEDAYLATYGTTTETADQFYLNQGDGSFLAISEQSGIQTLARSEGAAKGDYDNDGKLDIVVTDVGSQYRLYRNISQSNNNWLAVELIGAAAINRDAIGSTVVVTTNTNQVFRKVLMSGGSRGAGNQLRLHFGLGQMTIESAYVIWPDGTQFPVDLGLNRINQVNYASFFPIMVDGFE